MLEKAGCEQPNHRKEEHQIICACACSSSSYRGHRPCPDRLRCLPKVNAVDHTRDEGATPTPVVNELQAQTVLSC